MENTMVLNETNFDEISTIIESLKNKRNTGLSGISKEIPKLCSPIIEADLCTLNHKCLKKQTFPGCLNNVKFVPLYRNGNELNPEIYRHCSLLSPIGKILEKVLYKP